LVAASGALVGATSNPFNVTIGAPAKLVFSTQPVGAVHGNPLATQPIVQIQDAGGNLTNSNAQVTVAIGTNPNSGTLAGTKTVSASNGSATFAGLSIDNTGNGYTLTASATGLAGATSSPFNMT
jgi:hypothetical protein